MAEISFNGLHFIDPFICEVTYPNDLLDGVLVEDHESYAFLPKHSAYARSIIATLQIDASVSYASVPGGSKSEELHDMVLEILEGLVVATAEHAIEQAAAQTDSD